MGAHMETARIIGFAVLLVATETVAATLLM